MLTHELIKHLMNNIGTASELVAVLEGGAGLVCFKSIERGWDLRHITHEIHVNPDRCLKVTIANNNDFRNVYIDAHQIDTVPKLARELETLGIKFSILRAQHSLVKHHREIIEELVRQLEASMSAIGVEV